MVIAIDFDGTCVSHEFPKMGKDIGAIPVLKRLVAAGHKLILYTMRSNQETVHTLDKEIAGISGHFLLDAVKWFEDNNIPLYGVQRNPTQFHWTNSPKCYAELYIDDAALGIPLIYTDTRPYVDWAAVTLLLEKQGLI